MPLNQLVEYSPALLRIIFELEVGRCYHQVARVSLIQDAKDSRGESRYGFFVFLPGVFLVHWERPDCLVTGVKKIFWIAIAGYRIGAIGMLSKPGDRLRIFCCSDRACVRRREVPIYSGSIAVETKSERCK